MGPGSYHEVLNVTRKGPLTILGITHNPADYTANLVHVWNSSYINQTTQTSSQDNADAVVLTVSPNRAASLVGSGPLGAPLQPEFGCSDFKMYNIDVANRAVSAKRGGVATSCRCAFMPLMRIADRRRRSTGSSTRPLTLDRPPRCSWHTPTPASTAALLRATRTPSTWGVMAAPFSSGVKYAAPPTT